MVVMEGDLAGPYVAELRAVAASCRAAGGRWSVDLSGVGFADAKGVALLGELGAEGITLLGGSAFLRELLLGARAAGAKAVTDEERRDLDLIAALRQGDAGARETLVRRFGPELLATARRFLVSDDEAERAFRDAFLAAFEGLDGFPDGARLETWLHGIVVREALRRLRAQALRSAEEAALQPLLPRFTESGQRVLDEADDAFEREGPGAQLENLTPEMQATVRACIARLPGIQRAVFLLCDVEGFGVAQAASLLGFDLGEAKKRLRCSRQALRLLVGRSLGSTRFRTPDAQPISA
jgi:RNA polymerase sigma-70 factor (ECF subfamily)